MPSARLDPTTPATDAAKPGVRPAPDPSAAPGGARPTMPGAFRSTGFGPTGFGSTVFDALSEVEARERAERSVFDVCHVGVVLRALLFVHAVIVIGALFVATGAQGWILLVALGSSAALPGVLLWLLA
ncbi:MAG TPA: hypothetical protein VJO99_15980, partial [Burkholderiaceae bacterium]|nr:hypothetical protein [Burkholderiaceae bacterium]